MFMLNRLNCAMPLERFPRAGETAWSVTQLKWFWQTCLTLICLNLFQLISHSQTLIPTTYRLDRILIQPKAGVSLADLAKFHATHRGEVLRTYDGIGHLQVVRLPPGVTV